MSEQEAPELGQPNAAATGTARAEKYIKIGKWTVSYKDLKRFAIGFAISLALGKLLEMAIDRDNLQSWYEAQRGWIDAVGRMNPFSLIGSYIDDTARAYSGQIGDDGAHHGGYSILAPVVSLFSLLRTLLGQGAFVTIIQIGLGALAISALNMTESGGKRAFFGEMNEDGRTLLNLFWWPVAIVAAASIIAFALQILMLAALYLFSWITGFAAAAAGATGVGGFSWYCVTKLGEKGVEHVVTPKI